MRVWSRTGDKSEGMVQSRKIKLRVWSRTGQMDCGCDSVPEGGIRLRVWSGAIGSNGECGPGLEDYTMGAFQGLRIRLRVWLNSSRDCRCGQDWNITLLVWLRTGRSN